jgi:hypothetical protein
MDLWVWGVIIVIIAGVFLLISGEVIATVILTAVWGGAIWLLVEHGGRLMDEVWPAMLIVFGLVVLSVITLAVMATAIEDRRLDKDRGRPAPPR